MQDQIRSLLKKRRAILLAHNYQPPEIQDVADVCGDSLELSIKASQTDADVIVFCGVHFMAETASILSPAKTVLLPRRDAGCPMADMVTPEALKKKLAALPPMPVVTYVNSTAEVKALSTICCTSANAFEVVESLDGDEVLMVPDRNLALNTAARSRKKIHTWEGYCPFHNLLTVERSRGRQSPSSRSGFHGAPRMPSRGGGPGGCGGQHLRHDPLCSEVCRNRRSSWAPKWACATPWKKPARARRFTWCRPACIVTI